jgi:hypothetical protein
MRRWLACVLSLVLFLPTPLRAAWVADGNDHIDSANNAVTGVDVDSFSLSCWVNFSALTAGDLPQQLLAHAALIAGGNLRISINVENITSNPRLAFYEGFSGQAFSKWVVPDAAFSTSTWYQVGVDYNSNAANDPLLWINGASQTVSETTTPSGTRLTGSDSLRIGEDLNGTSDMKASIAECGFWNRRLTSGEWSNLGVDKWAPSKIPSGLVYYIPLISDTTETQGATGTLTATGGSFGTHPPGIVYPSSGRRAVAPMLLP